MMRRDAGWLIMQAAAAASSQNLFASWLEAGQRGVKAHEAHEHGAGTAAPPDPHDWANYQPKFFSSRELACLDRFSAILIPSDDTPGAREAYVSPFMDFVVNAAAEYAPEMQQHWREAVAYLTAHDFDRLALQQQEQLVHASSEGEHDRSRNDPGTASYRLIKEMTVHAFYTSRVGLIDALEYQGLAYLTSFPGCTHPEHHQV